MLVPLETLEGWPAAPDPSPLEALGLLVGFPALATAIIAALVLLAARSERKRGTEGTVAEPVWLGGQDPADAHGDAATVEPATSNRPAGARRAAKEPSSRR